MHIGNAIALPEHVKPGAPAGHTCMYCGGEVGEDGYALGGEVVDETEPEPDTEKSEESDYQFKKAMYSSLKKGGDK